MCIAVYILYNLLKQLRTYLGVKLTPLYNPSCLVEMELLSVTADLVGLYVWIKRKLYLSNILNNWYHRNILIMKYILEHEYK